ncbi:hypothetical protein MLD38_012841 [Melastoma candidum]|uniref:Uncharacterized protein n=1 Tax=Melastoma candidum TaxID=119954 RepID=A0ACB9R8R6_9MYRT|nr:hypothetical protein MLD38_012841 [Melastoma candidum]
MGEEGRKNNGHLDSSDAVGFSRPPTPELNKTHREACGKSMIAPGSVGIGCTEGRGGPACFHYTCKSPFLATLI